MRKDATVAPLETAIPDDAAPLREPQSFALTWCLRIVAGSVLAAAMLVFLGASASASEPTDLVVETVQAIDETASVPGDLVSDVVEPLADAPRNVEETVAPVLDEVTGAVEETMAPGAVQEPRAAPAPDPPLIREMAEVPRAEPDRDRPLLGPIGGTPSAGVWVAATQRAAPSSSAVERLLQPFSLPPLDGLPAPLGAGGVGTIIVLGLVAILLASSDPPIPAGGRAHRPVIAALRAGDFALSIERPG